MDLLSSIRKSGSRGGVNFSWDDVSTSQHRENYLGHSLMAPVGRWQKGRDLSWYAKGDDKNAVAGETVDEKKARERKEEIRRIKEAEEDALARALGLPVADRGLTGSNTITVGEVNRVVKEERIGEDADGDDESGGLGKGRGFGDFVGKVLDMQDSGFVMAQEGVLVGKDRKKEAKRQERITSRERKPMHHRHRSRSGERRRHRSRSGERHRHRHRHDDRDERRPRSRSIDRRERRYRSRSSDHGGRIDWEHRGGRRIERLRRSRSPPARDSRNHRERDLDRR